MGIDPLSNSTRVAKRNLLVASVAAVTYRAFSVKIQRIPVGNVSIEFDDRVFTFLLAIVLLYFLMTFLLYYFIDIRNTQPTMHFLGSEKRYHDKISSLASQTEIEILEALRARFPAFGFASNGHLANLLRSIEIGSTYRRVDTKEENKGPRAAIGIYDLKTTTPHNPQGSMLQDQNEKMRAESARIARALIRRYRRRFLTTRALALPRRYLVKLLYLTRDYFIDGALPVLLGAIALLAVYDVLSLEWLQHFAPAK